MEAAGAEFIDENGGGPRVRLRKPVGGNTGKRIGFDAEGHPGVPFDKVPPEATLGYALCWPQKA
jgi:hypothetical protein